MVDKKEVKRWTEYLGANEFEIPDEEVITNPAFLVAVAAKRCYNSFQPGLNPNVTKVRKDWTAYLDNIMSSGHGSVLEHAVYSFAFEGVSRVFTGEMNRHRVGVAISEASMRYIRFEPEMEEREVEVQGGPGINSTVKIKKMMPKMGTGIAWWMPLSIRPGKVSLVEDKPGEGVKLWGPGVLDAVSKNPELELKKRKTREIFEKHFETTEIAYMELLEIWKDELSPTSKFHQKKQLTSCFRRIVPMGVATGGVWTLNIRALRHVLTMRASPGAEEEIAHVFSRVAKLMIEQEPLLMGDFVQDEEGFWTPKYRKV